MFFKKIIRNTIFFLLIFIQTSILFGQNFFTNSDTLNKRRFIGTTVTEALAWGGTIGGLSFVWYNDFEKSKLHTFNDYHEWQQMDKMGHMVTSWNFARFSGDMFEWSGLNHKKASLIGLTYSIGYTTTFELLDGFSADWGFSWYDVGFNSLGAVTYWSQEFLWNKQFCHFKFSAHPTELAQYRPNVLGSDFLSQTFKDYNGQTYWMSFNPFYWFHIDSKIPEWINLSVGYGIDNQLYGDGSVFVLQNGNTQQTFIPYRQYYLSFDIDFESLPVKKPWLKFICRAVNVFKLPFPAVEFSEQGVKFKPFYF